jgi:archaellum biogenesis protein FlaJ (TadC family)
MDWINSLKEWGEANSSLLWWIFGISSAMMLLTPLLVSWIIIKLPKDYFVEEKRRRLQSPVQYPALRIVVAIVKNVLGAVLVVAGVIMLVAPGQGLLTIVVGLMLLDFPGKYRLERWLVTRRQVWRSIQWLRKRARQPELVRPE